MRYTERTFDLLTQSVLKHMADNNLEPVPIIKNRTNSSAIAEQAQRSLNNFLHLTTLLPQDNMKKSRFLMSNGESCFDEQVNFHSRNGDEVLFTYAVKGQVESNMYTRMVSKVGVSFGRILGDFNDDLMLPIGKDNYQRFNYNALEHIRSMSQQEQQNYLREHGTPQSALVKHLVNEFNANLQSAFVYFTDIKLGQHYKAFKQVRDVDTCLSKPNPHYRRKVNGKHIHPLNVLDKSPNVRLALIASAHHDKWEAGSYPFVGRCLVKVDGEGKVIGISRYYGDEKYSREHLTNTFRTVSGMRGSILKAIYDDNNELITIHADQLTSDSDDRNNLTWATEADKAYISEYCKGVLPEYFQDKNAIVMGYMGASVFGVTPSYDGKEVTSPRGDDYQRSDRPTPNAVSDDGGETVVCFDGLRNYRSECSENTELHFWIHDNDIEYDVDGQPYSEEHLDDGTIVRDDLTGEIILKSRSIKVRCTANLNSLFTSDVNMEFITEQCSYNSDDSCFVFEGSKSDLKRVFTGDSADVVDPFSRSLEEYATRIASHYTPTFRRPTHIANPQPAQILSSRLRTLAEWEIVPLALGEDGAETDTDNN